MLDQIGSCLIITDTAGIESGLFSGRDNVLILNLDQIEINALSRPADLVYPGDNAYIIFTSGTAGKPKGVVHSHRNIMRMVKDYSNAVQITPEDRVSLLSSCSFSMSVIDIFSALLNGAGLILYDVKKKGVNQIPLWLKTEKITILNYS